MKFYKLYHLDNDKLSSVLGGSIDISIGKPYSAKHEYNLIHFSNLYHILDWHAEGHGDIVCDVRPLGEVKGNWDTDRSGRIEGQCKTIIASNPRYIFSDNFLISLFDNDACDGLEIIIDNWNVFQIIEMYDTKNTCNGIPLCFSLEKALEQILIRTSGNKRINEFLQIKRSGFSYDRFLKAAIKKHAGIKAERIIIKAWNQYAPSKQSKRWKKLISIVSLMK